MSIAQALNLQPEKRRKLWLILFTLVGAGIIGLATATHNLIWLVLGSFVLGGLAILIGRLDRIFLVMVALLPLQVVVLPLGLNIQFAYLLTLVLLLSLPFFSGRELVTQTPFFVPTVLVILSMGIAVIWGLILTRPEVSINSSVFGLRGSIFRPFMQFGKGLIPISLVFIVPTVMFRYPGLFSKSIKLFLLSMTIASMYGIYQFFAQQYGWPLQDIGTGLNTNLVRGSAWRAHASLPRPRSFFFEPAQFGIALLMHIWIAIGLLSSHEVALRKSLLLISLVFAIMALVLTTSVGAYITLVVTSGLFVLGAFFRSKIKFTSVLLGLLIIAAVGTVIAYILPDVFDAALSRISFLEQTIKSRSDRYIFDVLEIAADSSFLGVGLGQYFFYEAALFGTPGGSAPMWLYVLVEQGIVGLVALISLLFAVFGTGIALLKSSYSSLINSILLALAGSLFHYSFSNGSYGMLEWFWIGMLAYLWFEHRRNQISIVEEKV